MKPQAVVASVGLLVSLGSVEGQAPELKTVETQHPVSAAGPVSLKPAKPNRVVNLKNGSFVIDKPGNWVLNRSWRFEDSGDLAPIIIDVVADGVELDFRGFEIEVDGVGAPPTVTVINVQGDDFTLKNAEVTICCEGGSLLKSTGDSTQIFGLTGFSYDRITFEGDRAVIRDSSFLARSGVSVASLGRIENSVIRCEAGCLFFAGDGNHLLNSRIRPDELLGVRVGGNGNVLAGNVIEVQPTGPTVDTAFDVDGNDNVIRDNTLAVSGIVNVAFDVSGTGNVLDANIADRMGEPPSRISVGIRFEQDGNYYGDNRMQANMPFDLGGTTQTDWGGNVDY